MADPWRIQPEVLRRMLEVTRGVYALPGDDPALRRRKMLAGMCQLVSAAAAVCFTSLTADSAQARARDADNHRPHPLPSRLESVVHVGLPAQRWRRTFGRWVRQPVPMDPAWPRLLRLLGHDREDACLVTRTRRQLLRNGTWYASAHVRTVRSPAGVDDGIYSALRLHNGRCAPAGSPVGLLCVSRPIGARPFTRADARLIHLLHSEMDLLYAGARNTSAACKAADNGAVTPRQDHIRGYLLKGLGEKQIAHHLGLSRHTVHSHIKALYRHHHVTSRAEFLSQFVRG